MICSMFRPGGLSGYDDRLSDPTDAAEQALVSRAAGIGERAGRLDLAALKAADRVTRAVVIHAAGSLADSISARVLEHTVADTFTSPSHDLLVNLPLVPVSGAGQPEAYLRRLAAVPRYLRAVADRHRAGLAAARFGYQHTGQLRRPAGPAARRGCTSRGCGLPADAGRRTRGPFPPTRTPRPVLGARWRACVRGAGARAYQHRP